MNYKWHYDRLIETRKNREIINDVYYERHHIIMKSMGGTDDVENLVMLTPREHFLAHWLLWRIHRNRETAYAFNSFVGFFTGHNHKNRPKITSSRGYAEARESYSIMHSKRMTGVLNSNRSKIVIQMDMDKNYIKEWPSAKEAYRELGISHITSCCRGERAWAGGYKWKYMNGIIKKSKPYKKRESSTVSIVNLTEINRKRISEAASERKWYNNGERDFFLKPFDNKDGLYLGRLANRKK